MDKVIVERPRHGSRERPRKKGYRKQLQKTGLADSPQRESMLGSWRGKGKRFNEHLSPMRRYLRSQVGRPWNHVYRDLREHVRFDNVVQKHVLTHVHQFVHRYVDVVEGQLRVRPGTGWGGRLYVGEMYVCPTTGLLKIVRLKQQQPSASRRVQFEPLIQYHLCDNIWWEVRLRKAPDDLGDLWDAWFERPAAVGGGIMAFGGKFIATSKRPLTPLEARQLCRRIRKARD